MGKDLKGKELGTGISQRKDGLYTARFTDRNGRRRQQYFKKLQECRKWLADAQFDDEHGNICACGDMTVDAWFDYWIENVKSASAKKNTISNYKNRYQQSIQPYIGNMLLQDVKPLHCQDILNRMAASGYKNATIGLVRTAMKILFEDAVENEMIAKNPVKKSVQSTQGKESDGKTAMTVEQQKAFLFHAEESSYYFQYALVLQTGIRVGELAGLKWSDVDFENRVLHICRTANRLDGEWIVGTPKSRSGKREIPLTGEAVKILKTVQENRRTDIVSMQYHDTVFISGNGNPIDNSTYNAALRKICDKAGIPRISMHTLRHTFATRCIEAGMQPKTLQEILGHAKIDMTMNVYVHVMEDRKNREMSSVESALKVV